MPVLKLLLVLKQAFFGGFTLKIVEIDKGSEIKDLTSFYLNILIKLTSLLFIKCLEKKELNTMVEKHLVMKF